jgi:hypothetical protein
MRMNLLERLHLQPERRQGLLFDGVMFLTNFLLLDSIFNTPIEAFSDRGIGLLLAGGALPNFWACF